MNNNNNKTNKQGAGGREPVKSEIRCKQSPVSNVLLHAKQLFVYVTFSDPSEDEEAILRTHTRT